MMTLIYISHYRYCQTSGRMLILTVAKRDLSGDTLGVPLILYALTTLMSIVCAEFLPKRRAPRVGGGLAQILRPASGAGQMFRGGRTRREGSGFTWLDSSWESQSRRGVASTERKKWSGSPTRGRLTGTSRPTRDLSRPTSPTRTR